MGVSIPGHAATTRPAPTSGVCGAGRDRLHGDLPPLRLGRWSSWIGEWRPRLPGLARAVRRPWLEPVAPPGVGARSAPGGARRADRTGPERESVCGRRARHPGRPRGAGGRGWVSVTLVEVLPELVERARTAAAEVAADVEVVAADAGCSETYVGLGTVPADVVLLVGVLGNISDGDVAATVAAMPRLCAPGATLLWSRGRSLEGADDFVTPVRRAFSAAGFAEVCIRSFDVEDDHRALGVVRFDGPPVPLGPRETWFTFVG